MFSKLFLNCSLMTAMMVVLGACNRQPVPSVHENEAPTAAIPEAKASAKRGSERSLTAEGLVKGVPHSGTVRGRVYMGGSDIGKAEVVLAEYDLKTATAGRRIKACG